MSVTFDRAALFEEVWAYPLTKLAAKYGLSDNGLRKVCVALEIPLPQRGHWARIAAGHVIPKPELPPTSGPTNLVCRPGSHSPPSLLGSEDQEWFRERIELEKDPANKVLVQSELGVPHPLVKAALRAFTKHREALERSRLAVEEGKRPRPPSARWEPNFAALRRPRWSDYVQQGVVVDLPEDILPLRVSIESADRALRIWDALLKACSSRCILSAIEPKRLRLSVRDEKVLLRLSEKVRREASSGRSLLSWMRDSRKCVGTGTLRIYVDERMYSDEPGKPLEEQLNGILVHIYGVARASTERRLRAEQERREAIAVEEHRAEERKIAEERWAAERKIAEERERLRKEELRRREQLIAEAEGWNRAEQIRSYVSHLQAAMCTSPSSRAVPELEEWLSWALDIAEQIDPTRARLNGHAERGEERPVPEQR